MKTLFTLVLAGILATSAVAQTQKGQSITSGNVNLSFNKVSLNQDKSSTYSAGFLVNRGRFIKDNLLLGYTLGMTYGKLNYDNSSYTISRSGYSSNGSVGLFMRRYWPILDRLYVYAGGGLESHQNKNSYHESLSSAGGGSESTSWQLRVNGQVGALYAVSNRIAIETNINNDFPTGLYNANFGIAILAGKGSATSTNLADFDAPQTQKGRWLLGASVNVTGSKVSQENGTPSQSMQSVATTSVSAANFVKNNLLVGVAISYSANRQGDASAPGAVNYSLAASPFVRSYIGKSRLRPFIEGRGDYGLSKSSDNSIVSARYVGASISAGLAYMAGDRFIIQTTVGSLGGRYNWYPSAGSSSIYSNYTINAQATTLSNISVAYSL